ncbi:MAG: family 20 glycosylhydrolase [Sphingobacteriaceae bacterium]|nr:family 20 glycosylhydrolase [Sphingobacteriaceae bacterium]
MAHKFNILIVYTIFSLLALLKPETKVERVTTTHKKFPTPILNTLDLNTCSYTFSFEKPAAKKSYQKEIAFFLNQMDMLSNRKVDIRIKTQKNNKQLAKNGSFILLVGPSKISITAKDSIGIYYALDELEKIKKLGSGILKYGLQIHQPKINKRFLHLVFPEKPDVKKMKSLLNLARYYHYNYIIFQLKKNVQLSSMAGIASTSAWTKKEFVELVNYAKAHNLKIVPEINFLTHQQHLFSDPALLYTKQTYNPLNKNVYQLGFKIIDELCELTKPEFFHIGHDELYGLTLSTKNTSEKVLPAKLFLYDVKKLNTYIQAKKIKTMMWGDMFLNAADFPDMNYHPMHANAAYKNLLPQVPKNIVICDWHYFDKKSFSSVAYFKENGFLTFGATWWRADCTNAFTNYLYKNIPFEKSGLITTTWPNALRKTNQKNFLFLNVENIIKNSGEAMWLLH